MLRLINDIFNLDTWEKIPVALSDIIEKPSKVEDYSSNTCYENSYNWYLRYYLRSFNWKKYFEDKMSFEYECKECNMQLLTTCNPFYYPSKGEDLEKEYIFFKDIRYDNQEYQMRYAADIEALSIALALFKEKNSMKLYTISKFIDFLHPMAYAVLKITT